MEIHPSFNYPNDDIHKPSWADLAPSPALLQREDIDKQNLEYRLTGQVDNIPWPAEVGSVVQQVDIEIRRWAPGDWTVTINGRDYTYTALDFSKSGASEAFLKDNLAEKLALVIAASAPAVYVNRIGATVHVYAVAQGTPFDLHLGEPPGTSPEGSWVTTDVTHNVDAAPNWCPRAEHLRTSRRSASPHERFGVPGKRELSTKERGATTTGPETPRLRTSRKATLYLSAPSGHPAPTGVRRMRWWSAKNATTTMAPRLAVPAGGDRGPGHRSKKLPRFDTGPDVVFVGNVRSREPRVDLMRALGAVGLVVYGNGRSWKKYAGIDSRGAVWGVDADAVHRSARVAVSQSRGRGIPLCTSVRLFNAAAVGACVAVEAFEGLDELYPIGAVQTFTGKEDAEVTIKTLLNDADRRGRMRREAEQHTWRHHTWNDRVRALNLNLPILEILASCFFLGDGKGK